MELSERCIATLEKEGFEHIYEWQDTAGTIYSEHSHAGKVTLFITDGSIELTIYKQIHVLKTGDRFDVSPHTSHSAIIGPNGVQFVVGEEIDGDA
jgi:quercetin dioxygenase-like cupin family protein